MSQRMIFFPNKRRISMRRVSLVAALMLVTLIVFLAGVRVGVQHAGVIEDNASILTVELASVEF
ncbi:MAG: hypothetical protein RLO08_08450 [Parvibaculaceae bacterium]|mgnify:CR=1 FL=1